MSNLSYPNWTNDGNVYIANAWKNYDWQVERIKKRGSEIFRVSRKSKNSSFRKWLDEPTIQEAFRKIKIGKK